MKLISWLLPLLLLLSACQPVSVTSTAPIGALELGGGASDVGSAGDNHPDDYLAAWFLGEKKIIQVCLEVAPDFGVDKSQARATIQEAFKNWKHYIEGHHIHFLRHFYDLSEAGDLALATQVAISEKCSAQSELRFYLGVENSEVRKARRKFFHPTAFVQRESFGPSIPLGKGFIWIAKAGSLRGGTDFFPNWKREGRLLAILLHEIGHIYGNDHIAGTVMSADISKKLDSQLRGPVLASIDHCRELGYGAFSGLLSEVSTGGTWEAGRNDFIKQLSLQPFQDRYFFYLHRGDFEFDSLSISSGDDWENYFLHVAGGVRPSREESGLRTFKVLKGSEIWSYPDISYVRYYAVSRQSDFKDVGSLAIEYNLSACDAQVDLDKGWRSPVEVVVQARNRFWRLSPFEYFYPSEDANSYPIFPLEKILEKSVEPNTSKNS